MADSTIPAILVREQFDRVQQLLHTRGMLPPRAAGSPHLLAGLIRCGRCGSSLQFNRYDTWAYYRCAGKGAAGGCDAPAIPALPLEEAVGRLVCDRYGALAAAALHAEQRALQRSRQAEQQTGQARIAARRQQLAASARRVDHDYLSGTISAAERRQLLTQLATESTRLREAEQALREEQPPSPQRASEDDPWVALTVAEQKQLLPLLVASLSAVRESPRQVRLAITWFDSAPANERAEEQGRQEDGAEGP